MTTPVQSSFSVVQALPQQPPKEKISLPELLSLLHEKSPKFTNEPQLWHRLVRKLTPEQAEVELPLLFKLLESNPISIVEHKLIWKALKNNSALHDAYIAHALNNLHFQPQNALPILLEDAYLHSIPELAQKILLHPSFEPSRYLFSILGPKCSLEELRTVLNRFGLENLTQKKINVLVELLASSIHLTRAEQIVGLLKDMGADTAALIRDQEYSLLKSCKDLPHLKFWLSFFSVTEQQQALSVTAPRLLYLAMMNDEFPLESFGLMFNFLIERQFSPSVLFLHRYGKLNSTLLDLSCRYGIEGLPELIISYLDDASLKIILTTRHPRLTYDECNQYRNSMISKGINQLQELIRSHEIRLGLV